jgi:SAM-dependent methyltransferase
MTNYRLHHQDVGTLRCLHDGHALDYHAHRAPAGQPVDELLYGHLSCANCRREYRVDDGIPRLFDPSEVTGADRILRAGYDRFAPLHDAAATILLPLLQNKSEFETRAFYVERIELDRLATHADGTAPRILEIGIGGGANLPYVLNRLPQGLDVEMWGSDLSEGMLRECAERVERLPRRVRLLQCDAHQLPFPDASFDRVFHSGAIGAYRDPAAALAEMGRVARPGTPIVVVDEQLDPGAGLNLVQRAAFQLITLPNRDPRAPRDLLPPGAIDVLSEQASPFFYSLRFRMR